jgi:hypothetical protein
MPPILPALAKRRGDTNIGALQASPGRGMRDLGTRPRCVSLRPQQGVTMKLRLIRTTYFLALAVAFAVAAGADRKFG